MDLFSQAASPARDETPTRSHPNFNFSDLLVITYWPDIYLRRIIRLDKLGQEFFSSSDNPSVYKYGQQTDYPSRRTICLVRLGRRTKVDNPSVCINAGTDELRCQSQHLIT